jgi:hypothetical protein
VTTPTTTLTASVTPTSCVADVEPDRRGRVAVARAELADVRQRVAHAWSAFEVASATADATEARYQTIIDGEISELELAYGNHR